MKKLYLILLILPLLSLTSCGEPPSINSDFSAVFSVQNEEITYTGTLNRCGDQLSITMTEPYTVAGLTFSYTDSQLNVQREHHSTYANADYLPAESIPSALRNSILYITQASYTGSENGTDTFTVETPYGEAALSASYGYLKEITEPHSGMTFRFTNISEPIES